MAPRDAWSKSAHYYEQLAPRSEQIGELLHLAGDAGYWLAIVAGPLRIFRLQPTVIATRVPGIRPGPVFGLFGTTWIWTQVKAKWRHCLP